MATLSQLEQLHMEVMMLSVFFTMKGALSEADLSLSQKSNYNEMIINVTFCGILIFLKTI